MTTIRKTGSKRRKMYFRESSKRDTSISQEEEARRYHDALFEVCEDCMATFSLEDSRVTRRLGECRICGNDGWINGCIKGGDERIEKLRNGE